MNRFINNLSTRAKLILGFGAIWLLLAVVVVTAYVSLARLTQSEKDLYNLYFTEALGLQQLRSSQNFNRAQILDMMLATDTTEQHACEQAIQERARQIDGIVEELLQIDPGPQFQSRLQDLKNAVAEYRQTREQEIALIYEGKVEEARQLGLGLGSDRFEEVRSIAAELGDRANAKVDQQLVQDQQLARSLTLVSSAIGGVAFLLGVGCVVILNQIIAKPLRRLTDTAEHIAAGNLDVTVTATARQDEVGLLTQMFSRMVQSLRDIANVAKRIAAGDLRGEVKPQSEKDLLGNSLAQMAENLRRSTAEISEAVALLGSSASEILAATTQVASGTTETATAISETTTTVEQVRQAAQLSAQKSRNVSDSARHVAEVSQSGLQAVEETMGGMNRIREQMETIAQTVVRLSEQSQSIGGIIASVNDLADQSNLLAVNAAIEAAKAGEQGKGFAVVAQEIKSLAEQSKQATAQVRTILSDIQKATGAAVMATEQGSKAVEAGVKQAAQSGEAIQVLAESTQEAVQTAMQVAASSQQQVVGMDQIGVAMENINQAGAQTAASMKQAEIAAQNLHELGQKLKELVEQFKT
jgi:methyl-accepting chemotaxis protein